MFQTLLERSWHHQGRMRLRGVESFLPTITNSQWKALEQDFPFFLKVTYIVRPLLQTPLRHKYVGSISKHHYTDLQDATQRRVNLPMFLPLFALSWWLALQRSSPGEP